jgi:hypothetical protein
LLELGLHPFVHFEEAQIDEHPFPPISSSHSSVLLAWLQVKRTS